MSLICGITFIDDKPILTGLIKSLRYLVIPSVIFLFSFNYKYRYALEKGHGGMCYDCAMVVRMYIAIMHTSALSLCACAQICAQTCKQLKPHRSPAQPT